MTAKKLLTIILRRRTSNVLDRKDTYHNFHRRIHHDTIKFPKMSKHFTPKTTPADDSRIGRYFKLTESNQTCLLHLTFHVISRNNFQAEAIWFAPISSCSVMTRTNGKLVALLPFAATWIWSSLPRTQSDSFLTSCTCLFFSLRFSYLLT